MTRLRVLAAFLFGALVFSLAYCQAPLYYSNQNQYFLHPLAEAGHGFLADDWLANTADPTPVFSLLVSATYRFLHPYAFHVYYALLLAAYFGSLIGIFGHLAGKRATPQLAVCFLAALVLVHSAVVRWASYRLLDLDYACYFQGWLAGQYVLGAMFQPSTFGVLLVLAIHLFLKDRPFWAVTSACLAATVHSTYLLGAATLTLAFLWVLWREGHIRRALLLGGWALVLVLPITTYLLVTFRPTSATIFADAQQILVHVRIPHHCLPRLWCDPIAVGQIAWILLALVLTRGTRLFVIMLVSFLVALVLTLLQVFTESDTLALLFPWRISVFLVPLATAVILGRLVLAGASWLDSPRVSVAASAVVASLAAGGVAIMYFQQGFQSSPEEVRLMEFVKGARSYGDVYLLPVQVPDLKASTRGSLSSDFKPVAAKKTDSRLIPVDLQRFRLYTGVPIFVDFKAIPYQDADVLEWRRRLELNRTILEHLRAGKLDPVWHDLRHFRITHVVLTANDEVKDARLRKVYEDEVYRVYQLIDPASGPVVPAS